MDFRFVSCKNIEAYFYDFIVCKNIFKKTQKIDHTETKR